MVGDIEFASYGAQFYCKQSILCGAFLPATGNECASLALKMVSELDCEDIFCQAILFALIAFIHYNEVPIEAAS